MTNTNPKDETMDTRTQIKEAGVKLAGICPNAKVLIAARSWWKSGTLYSNHDFDILSSLTGITRIEKNKTTALDYV